MVRKHNRNIWANDRKEVIRPSNERIKVEIFSFDHKLTKTFLPLNRNIRGVNNEKTNHRHMKVYKSEEKDVSFTLEIDIPISKIGEYRFDILYECYDNKTWLGAYDFRLKAERDKNIYSNTANVMAYANKIESLNKKVKSVKKLIEKEKEILKKLQDEQKEQQEKDKDKKTDTKEEKATKSKIKEVKQIISKYQSQLSKTETLIGKYEIKLSRTHRMSAGNDLVFDGFQNILKRKTLFKKVTKKGTYLLTLEIPPNACFIGLAVRKLIKFTGDNLDSVGTNLMFKEATISKSGQVKPAEASFEIGYDDSFENSYTSTGFYFDYLDEVNIYVKKDNKAESSTDKIPQRFGGYLSTISHDTDRSKITFNCADRLIDGEAKYILDSMLILNGTTKPTDSEYNNPINFNSYGEALSYLCKIHEVTLKSNIKKNYLVEGEKYNKGFNIRFGKKKDIHNIKKIVAKNSTVAMRDAYITVRNKPSNRKEQSIMLYNAKEYAKTPVMLKEVVDGEIKRNNLTFHMTYGLGNPVKTTKTKTTEQTSNADGSSGNYGKCGQSADKKTVMAIGQISAGRNEGLSSSTYYKTVFKNYCPRCKGTDIRWDSCRSDTNCINNYGHGGTKRDFPVAPTETEVTCNDCDCDFDAVTGWEKDGGFSSRLTTVVKPVKSSYKEQTTLHEGKMSGAGAVTVSADNIFKEITKEAFKYRYQMGGGGQTWAEMKKIGYGDCFGFSDLIYRMLSKFGVKCKITEYHATGGASNHHSVLYMNSKGQWEDFPYRELKWNTRYNNMLNNTDGSKSGKIIAINKAGKSIDKASGSISSTTKTTTEVTTTTGYDKDKPSQAYIEIVYATERGFKKENGKPVTKKKINLTFTQRAGTNNDITGLPNYWINNAHRQVSIDMKDYFADNEPNKNIYLHSIRFVTPEVKASIDPNTGEDTSEKVWYTYNKQTHDHSSCKMDLYQIIFDDRGALNPTDLQSCGKTVNAMMEEIVNQSGYRMHIDYATHRVNDRVMFSVDKQNKAKFKAQEGDNDNILEWSNISCSPVSVLRNRSISVFKNSKEKYEYVDTGDVKNILMYGEQATLSTDSEVNGSKQAYYIARNNKDYNPEFDYTYTIVVPYAPNLQLGDLVETISYSKYLNDIKPLESLQINYSSDKRPSIRSTLGLGEIEPFLRIKQDMQKLRKANKKKNTFSTTATPVKDDSIYEWDR